MRLHLTDTYSVDATTLAHDALQACKDRGQIANHLHFKALSIHRSSFGQCAIEIQFETFTRDRGRRQGNSGSYGAMESGVYTATYDEWGFFLAELYRRDEGMRCGGVKWPTYRDASDFHEQTGRTYDSAYPDHVERYGDDFGYRDGRNVIGRRGAGRVHYDSSRTRYATEDERTAEWIRSFQAGEVF